MSLQARILVVDDEVEVGTFFRCLLERKGYRVAVAASGQEAREAINDQKFHVAVVDLKLPDFNGLFLLQEIKKVQPGCEVIIMTGYSTTRTAVRAIQLGAYDYIEKPFEDISQIEALIDKALDFAGGAEERKKRLTTAEWGHIAARAGIIVGNSRAMNQLLSVAFKIARKDVNVLIQGETGTGKEVLARFIHAASHRSDRPFIPVNCGALPENLLESELFGHEKGAFTGATGQRRGIFELANHGTLFLDEIGEASLSIQVKLLRVLETGEFMRVGGEKPIKTDVRVIAATNVDLEQAVREKSFREDLFYRLDVVRLHLPPLRERKEDIPVLVNHFLNELAGHGTGQSIKISPEAMKIMMQYSWPGNVRELVNAIHQAAALCDGTVILPGHLSNRITGALNRFKRPGAVPPGDQPEGSPSLAQLQNLVRADDFLAGLEDGELPRVFHLLKALEKRVLEVMSRRGLPCPPPATIEEMEREAINQALSYSRGNITLAARILGIGRNTLYRKLKEMQGEARNS
ncbi:two component, sigma54 specific, transcriptional regulator, Fis family [Desulfofundulus kuznetsovii DSM 6115]|uniref:Stage 0 sporulation protein A homolog n=1 Tax=Desulfofundulus kuznetsovii (strain DSM 6115 / VKM B-1805 / 17) TaxID=760568 RepID=A0AAU8PED6_DESK7|nr:two component, sigma54 specific, transcriptional regulator, Fis family [Desulfofundulus kuznetsovii DSM 6115]